jgi:hypothetical protein
MAMAMTRPLRAVGDADYSSLVNIASGVCSQTSDSIVFDPAQIFFLAFSAQKSHVKPQNHLSPHSPTTSAWHFSYAQPDIIETGIKKSPGQSRGFTLKRGKLPLTPLPGRI